MENTGERRGATHGTTAPDEVDQVLQIDARGRRLPEIGDDPSRELRRLESLKPHIANTRYPCFLGQSLQEIDKSFELEHNTGTSFKEELQKRLPVFRHLSWDNLVLAGGSIARILRKQKRSDFDLFVYGLSEGAATERLKKLCREVTRHARAEAINHAICHRTRGEFSGEVVLSDTSGFIKLKDAILAARADSDAKITIHSGYAEKLYGDKDLPLTFTRTGTTLTIVGRDQGGEWKLQVILRIYANPSQVLRGFDVGASAVGFDGQDVWLTPLGAFAYECGKNVVDTTRRSTTYERRLAKYFKMGFDLVLPGLDLSKLQTDVYERFRCKAQCCLPRMLISYEEIRDNRVYGCSVIEPVSSFTSDYDEEYAIRWRNLQHILAEEYDEYICRGTVANEVFQSDHADDSFLFDRMYEGLFADALSHNFPQNRIQKYVTVATAEELFGICVAAFREPEGAKALAITERGAAKTRRLDEARLKLDGYCARQKAAVRAGIAKLREEKSRVRWLTENPGTQLTSSLNPVIEDPGSGTASSTARLEPPRRAPFLAHPSAPHRACPGTGSGKLDLFSLVQIYVSLLGERPSHEPVSATLRTYVAARGTSGYAPPHSPEATSIA